jgi:hypothetical protein
VAIGIAEINRVRNFVILEFNLIPRFLSSAAQRGNFPLRETPDEAFEFRGVRTFRPWFAGNKAIPVFPLPIKSAFIPHTIMKPLESENVDVFGRRSMSRTPMAT